MNLLSRLAIVGVVFLAITYQFLFKSILFDTLGYGRTVLSIKHFENVKCEKIDELGLEGCEGTNNMVVSVPVLTSVPLRHVAS